MMQAPSSRIPPVRAAAVASNLYKPCDYLQAKYASGDGLCQFFARVDVARVEVRMEGETVWLNQNQMAELFLSTKQNVGQHIRNVFAEGKLASESVVKDFFTTAADGKQFLSRIFAVGGV